MQQILSYVNTYIKLVRTVGNLVSDPLKIRIDFQPLFAFSYFFLAEYINLKYIYGYNVIDNGLDVVWHSMVIVIV